MNILCYTLGCKLNQMESDAILDAFRKEGWQVLVPSEVVASEGVGTPGSACPDLIIINTCTVTGKAEQKARRMIRKYLRDFPATTVVVTGCFAQLEGKALQSIDPRVVVIGQDEKPRLLTAPVKVTQGLSVRQALGIEPVAPAPAAAAQPVESAAPVAPTTLVVANQDPAPSATSSVLRDTTSSAKQDPFAYTFTRTDRGRPFIKIQDGCNNRCAYCRVPLARGNAVSLPAQEVVKRVQKVVDQGFEEYVLTGVNLSLYKDTSGYMSADTGQGKSGVGSFSQGKALDFAGLLKLLLQEVPGARIRLSSVEPNYITPAFLAVFAHPRICPHVHLPIQSGSDKVLSLAGRKYSKQDVIAGVEALRKVRPDVFIGADIITGLPGEGEAEFAETKQLLTQLAITQIHVFPFSPRPGTQFFGEKRCPESVRDARAKELRELSAKQLKAYQASMEGKKVAPILVSFEKNSWQGLTENYLSIKIPHTDQYKRGKIVEIVYKKDS